MHNPFDKVEYSSIEDLDPDPRPGRSAHAREFLLGALLLLAAIGWSGWQWWHQQSLQNRYQIARQAAARQDWDSAQGNYVAAGEYRDARARAAEAAKMIANRDLEYTAAQAA